MSRKHDAPIRARELHTIYFAVAEYHALEITCHRNLCLDFKKGRASTRHQDAISNLMETIRKLMAMDHRPMARVSWPLAVAMEAANKPEDKGWIRESVRTVRRNIGTVAWLNRK